MEENNHLTNDDLFKRATDYVNTNIELAKLNIIEKSVKTVGSVISNLILVVVCALCLLFLSFAMGFYLGEILSSTYLGFIIVAAFYLVVAIIIALISTKHIKNPIINILISKIFKNS